LSKPSSQSVHLKNLNSSRQKIQAQIDTLEALRQDKRKIKDLLSHCIYSIYRQNDLSEYFTQMVSISKLVRAYYQESLNSNAQKEFEKNMKMDVSKLKKADSQAYQHCIKRLALNWTINQSQL